MRCVYRLLGAVAMAGVGLAAGPAGAAVVNGGFENGNFAGWTTIGDAAVVNAADGVLPSGGAFMAALGNEVAFGGLAVSSGAVANFFGVPLGDLEAAALNIAENPGAGPANFLNAGSVGSAILQTFTAEAGTEVTVSFNFGTNEFENGGANDSALVFFDGEFTLLADTGSAFPDSGADFDLFTGFQTVTFQIDSTGDHTIGFALLDEDDQVVDSVLLIDDVVLERAEDVPAAPGLPLLAMGLAGLAALRLQSVLSNRK